MSADIVDSGSRTNLYFFQSHLPCVEGAAEALS